MLANPERGEVLLEIGGKKVILCAEIKRLAAFSARINNPPLRGLFERLHGSEVEALLHFVDAFTIDGDAEAIKARMKTLADIAAVTEAAIKVLAVFIGKEPEPKNG